MLFCCLTQKGENSAIGGNQVYQWKEHDIIPCASVGFGNLCMLISQSSFLEGLLRLVHG
jgi:hypothetical protein